MFFLKIFQQYQKGDVAIYYDNAPNYYFISTIQNIDNYTDYPFKIYKINDIGLVLIDIALNDWSQGDDDITAIELELLPQASIRIKFEHIKGYDAVTKLKATEEKMYVLLSCVL